MPEPVADALFAAIFDAVRALCDEGERALDRTEATRVDAASAAPRAVWTEPALSDEPIVDAVSPVFRVRPDTLAAFARDARATLQEWGAPPWHRTC